MPILWSVLINRCSDRHALQIQQDEAQNEVSRKLFSPALQNQATTTIYFSKWNIIIAIVIGFAAWYMISKGILSDAKTAFDAIATGTEQWLETVLKWSKNLVKEKLKATVEVLEAQLERMEE